MWVSMERSKSSYGSGREKINLGYATRFYEVTEANLKLAAEIVAKGEAILAFDDEVQVLKEQLEKGINLEYFGIKER